MVGWTVTREYRGRGSSSLVGEFPPFDSAALANQNPELILQQAREAQATDRMASPLG